MKQNIKYVIKVVIFCFLLYYGIKNVENILRSPKEDKWNKSGIEELYRNKDLYDVLVFGPSTTISNINYQELFSEYGIAGKCMGDPLQPMYLSYYLLEESLKYQIPKVVMLDVKALFYSTDDILKQQQTHDPIDRMKNNDTKYNAFMQMKELGLSSDIWEYFSEMYHSHSNWEKLSKDNFLQQEGSHIINDYTAIFTVADDMGEKDIEFDYSNEELEKIPEIDSIYLYKMIQLCQKKEISFVLIKGFANNAWSVKTNNTVKKIVEDNSLEYIDMSEYEDSMNFDWKVDSTDWVHHNIIGAWKWTTVLGSYLKDNFDLPDRRNESRYSKYQGEAEIKNEIAFTAMQEKIELFNALDFDTYLEKLMNIDRINNTIILTVGGNAVGKFTVEEMELLQKLGIKEVLSGEKQYNYVAILDNNNYREEFDEKYIQIDGNFSNGVLYTVTSTSDSVNNTSAISLDGKNIYLAENGINIVVYNKTFNEVLSSVSFDTDDYENPLAEKLVVQE